MNKGKEDVTQHTVEIKKLKKRTVEHPLISTVEYLTALYDSTERYIEVTCVVYSTPKVLLQYTNS